MNWLLIIDNEFADPDHLDWRKATKKPVGVRATRMMVPFTVETVEGIVSGDPGDFLIRGIEGELYQCNTGVFQRTYEFDNLDWCNSCWNLFNKADLFYTRFKVPYCKICHQAMERDK